MPTWWESPSSTPAYRTPPRRRTRGSTTSTQISTAPTRDPAWKQREIDTWFGWRVSDIADRWPDFAARVNDLGVGSYLSAPLTVDDEHLGAVNIYSFDPHGFSNIDEVLVRLLVTAAEAAVRISRRAKDAQFELDGLVTAMRTRADIEQAKGIIMAVRGISADAAFDVLSRQSQNENVKVSVLAASMISSVTAQSQIGSRG